ncbi:MAG: transcriptional repressor [Acidaminococcaceae bacterium]|nr:transcriptional repressor [Acidaminococcaceae bacterium]
MLTREQLSDCLHENGYKATPQRLAVYECLARTNEHPTAEALYARLHPEYPAMSFSTVYKTMDILHKLNLVKVLNMGEESARYDADISCHQHIQCTDCGRVEDLRLDLAAIRKEAGSLSHYEVQAQELYIYGLCPACRKKESLNEL